MAQREKIILEGDSRGAEDALNRTDQGFEKLTKNIKRAVTGGAIAILGERMAQAAAHLLDVGSAAQEARSAFDTTFGPAASRLTDELEEFSIMAGISRGEMTQLLATTGNFTQGLGATREEAALLSEEVVRLAGDVTSFRNVEGGTQRVIEALTSAMAGEREQLKLLVGPVSEAEVQTRALADTGKDAASELTRLEKAQATLALASERAGVAIGDLERTQDSYTNQMRALGAEWRTAQEELGERLIPKVAALIPTIRELIPNVIEAAEAFVEFLDALMPAIEFVVRNAGPALNDLTTAWQALGGIFSESQREAALLSITLGDVRQMIRDGVDPVDAYASGLENMAGKANFTRENAIELGRRIGLTTEEIEGTVFWLAEWALTADVTDATLANLTTTASNLAERELPTLAETEATLRSMFEQLNLPIAEQNRLLREAGIETGGTVRRFREVERAARNVEVAFFDLIEPTADITSNVDDLADSLITARDAQVSLSSVLLAAADPVFGAVDAMERYQSLLEQVNEDGKVTAEEQLEIAAALLTLQGRLDQLDPSTLEAGLVGISTALGISVDEVRELLTQLGILDGTTVTAVVEIEGSSAADVIDTVTRRRRVVDAGAFARGGVIPGNPGDAVRATVHAGEIVVPVEGAQALPEALQGRLAGQLGVGGSGGGGGISIAHMEVHVTAGGFDLTNPAEARRLVRTITNAVERVAAEGPRRRPGVGIS